MRLAALLVVAASACTPDPEVLVVYAPYEGGPVFPNQRPKIELPNGEAGFTSDNGSDTITALDLSSGDIIGRAPVGRSPLDLDGPHHLAADQAHGLVYVALAYPVPEIAPGPHGAHGLSTRAGFVQKLALDDLRPLGEVRVDENPGDIVMSDDGARVVVAHYDLQKAIENAGDVEKMRATLAVLTPDAILPSGSAEPLRITSCVAPHGVALSRPDGATAYVACYGEDAIAIVNTGDATAEVERVPVGSAPSIGFPTYGPYSAVMSPSGTLIAIGNLESRDVRLFDVALGAMSGTPIACTGSPYFAGWSVDGAMLYIPTQDPDAVLVADASAGTIVDSRALDAATCIKPHEVVASGDGTTLYLVCEGDHVAPGKVLALDAADLSTRWSAEAGVYPDRLAVVGGPR